MRWIALLCLLLGSGCRTVSSFTVSYGEGPLAAAASMTFQDNGYDVANLGGGAGIGRR